MRRIQAEDAAVISSPPTGSGRPSLISARIPQWWPSSVKIVVRRHSPELIGSQVQLKPYGGRAFVCEVESIREGAELRLQY